MGNTQQIIRRDPALDLAARMRGEGTWIVRHDGREVGRVTRETVPVGTARVMRRQTTFTTVRGEAVGTVDSARQAISLIGVDALVPRGERVSQQAVFALLLEATVEAAA